MWLLLFAALAGRQPIADDPSISLTARAQSRTIYLNKNGVTLTPGANDARTNRSSIISAPVSVPGWNTTPAIWSQTVTCLREMFAPFDVAITETDPGDLPHIEAVFGGSPALLGLPGNFAGVSPFSSTCKIIESSMVFTFADAIPQNGQIACEVMAQEIAHSYGLDHEMLAGDPMSYLSFKGKRTFQNVMAECGETSARPCGVGPQACRTMQNSYALLMERIGAAGTGDIDPPSVAITSPADGAKVAPGFTVTANISDDVHVKLAVMSIDGVNVASLAAAPWTFTAPADLAPGTHVIEIRATDGAHEATETIAIDVPGAEDEAAAVGCSSTSGTSWLFGLFLVGLVAIQRRAQR